MPLFNSTLITTSSKRQPITIFNTDGLQGIGSTSGVIANGANFPSNANNNLRTSDLPKVSGNFTIELYSYLNDTSGGRGQLLRNWGMSGSTYQAGSFDFYYDSTSSVRLDLYSDDSAGATTITCSAVRFQWHHWAIVRSGTSVTLYKDGVSQGSVTWTDTLNDNNQQWYFGLRSLGTDCFNGRMDEFRLSKVARYPDGTGDSVADFTPTTTALINDIDTLLLLHFEEVADSAERIQFLDDNS